MKKIAILGSTGSIGTQTLEVVRENGDIEVLGLAAGSNIKVLEEQIREFHPQIVAVWSEEKAEELRVNVADTDTQIVAGMDGLLGVATMNDTEILVTAVVGMIGIRPTIEAIKAGKDIALANKETLVTAGHIIMPLAKKMVVSILPVDSEHSAIFQSLQGNRHGAVHKILLTASGGPFRGKKSEELMEIKVEDALKHPNWSMGRKITIDSSTMVNKGLEVIEASRLFDVPPSRIDVTVHPQSIVHSMVEFRDGATIAQASPPDMRLPIALGLSAPERLGNIAAACDWAKAATWTFEPLDDEAFPAVSLARHCLEASEKHTAVLNAANEQAVHAFLEHRLPYLGIVDTVREVLDEMDAELRGNPLFASVEEMSQLELEARHRADNLINK